MRRERGSTRFALLAVALIAAGGAATALLAARGGGAAPLTSEPLYGLSGFGPGPHVLSRLDPTTLAPTGKPVAMAQGLRPFVFSPSGRELLLLGPHAGSDSSASSQSASFSIVDLTDMRVEAALNSWLAADFRQARPWSAWWPAADKLIVVLQQLGGTAASGIVSQSVLAIDPRSGIVEWRRSLSSALSVEMSGTAAGRLILLFGSRGELGAEGVVATVSPDGVLKTTGIRLARGGYRGEYRGVFMVPSTQRGYEEWLVTTAGRSPGAYVMTGGGGVYSIDPLTGRATLHVVPTPPAAPDTSPSNLGLEAGTVGSNIVVTAFFPRANGAPRTGVYLIDTATWRAKLLDRATLWWLDTTTTLLTYSGVGKGTGITIYDANGQREHHLYGSRAFRDVQAGALDAWAETSPNEQALLFDPVSGQTLGSSAAVPRPWVVTPTFLETINDRTVVP